MNIKTRLAAALLSGTMLCLSALPCAALSLDDVVEYGSEGMTFQDEEWREYVDVTGVYQTEYIRTEDEYWTQRVLYCNAPAVVTVLKSSSLKVGSSVVIMSEDENGQLARIGMAEPEYKLTVEDDMVGERYEVGTYWVLDEGIYRLPSVAGNLELLIVVENGGLVADNGQSFMLSQPYDSFEDCYYDHYRERDIQCFAYNVTEDTVLTLPETAERGYEVVAAYSSDMVADGIAASRSWISPGEALRLDQLCEEASGSYYTLYIYDEEREDPILVLNVLLNAPSFSDVPEDAYYFQPVGWAVLNEITVGTGADTFSPELTCTCGQILTFLWRALGSPEPKTERLFPGEYYSDAVSYMAEIGVLDDVYSFAPNAPCTRLTAVEYMWRFAGCPEDGYSDFVDVSSPAVDWALSRGITAGTGERTFSPGLTCTRAQIITLLYRMIG